MGILSDKSIIECCLLDMKNISNYIDLFIPSIHDAGEYIYSRNAALNILVLLQKEKVVEHVIDILMNYFLPQYW